MPRHICDPDNRVKIRVVGRLEVRFPSASSEFPAFR
jgi:hypothetical protein